MDQFYLLLERVRKKVGGYRYLRDCEGTSGWPERGVYFFFEEGETREDGSNLRVVRIGTHAVSEGATTTLWSRLAQHRGNPGGTYPGGGNHRGSIFRLHVGTAFLNKHVCPANIVKTWAEGSSADKRIRTAEYPLEKVVSEYIGEMPFLWLAVGDRPSRHSNRAIIEQNALALLSNYGKDPIDAPSLNWLGYHAHENKVKKSGLWNAKHVTGAYNPSFLSILARYVGQMTRLPGSG